MQCWTIFHFCPSPSVWLELDSPSDASLLSSGIFSCSVSVQCLWSVCWLLWRWGCVFVSSSSACCVLPAELRPGGRFGWRGVAPVELWMEVKRGWGLASGGHTPLHPKHFRLSPTPLPHPLLSPLCPNSHHPRVAWGLMRVTGDVSLSLSVFLLCCFSFSRYTLVLISLFLSFPDFCWESQNERGPFSRNWSADVEKTRQRHTVSWFSSSANYQQDSAENTFLGFYLIIVSSQNLEDVLWGGLVNKYKVYKY